MADIDSYIGGDGRHVFIIKQGSSRIVVEKTELLDGIAAEVRRHEEEAEHAKTTRG